MAAVIYTVIIAALIGADQLTKWLAVSGLKGAPAVPLLKNVFELEYVENSGAAFGIFAGKRFIFIVLTAAIVVMISVMLYRGKFRHNRWTEAAALMIIAGGIGNLIDRVFHGFVVDFLYFKLIDFPVFNFADCCVCIGAAIMLIYYFFFYEEKKKDKQPSLVVDTLDKEEPHGAENDHGSAGTGDSQN